MDSLSITVDKREVLGKKVRFMRREGVTPVHIFGHNVESLALQCDTDNLKQLINQAGTTRLVALKIEGDKSPRSVFIREIQRNELNGNLLHVDFYQIQKEEKIKADIPIVFIGDSPAMHLKGRILDKELDSISVECLPDKLPPQIEVDLSVLEELDQVIHVSDIDMGPDVSIQVSPEQMIVKVTEIKVVAEEEVMVEGAEVVEGEEGEEGEEGAAAEGEEKPGAGSKPPPAR